MKVTVFFLGGTISMTRAPGGGIAPALGSAELLEELIGLSERPVEVESVDFRRVGSSHLSVADIFDLVAAADRAVAQGADGVVVVQGTDSMEESSYLLDLLWPHDVPVVFTGAMRGPDAPGADGPANLAAALAVVADTEARGLGALVVLGEEIHAARFVAKLHTNLPHAFSSPGRGPLGVMLEGVPQIHVRVTRKPALPRPERADVVIPVLTATLGQDAREVEALATVADGLVVAGFGAGHVNAAVADALGELATRLPVVLATRTGTGAVHARTYAGVGSELDLLSRGLLSAGHLPPLKARLLLALAMAQPAADPAGVFAAHGGVGTDTMG